MDNAVVDYSFQLIESPYHTLCIQKTITHSLIINTPWSIYNYLLLSCCSAFSQLYHRIILYTFIDRVLCCCSTFSWPYHCVVLYALTIEFCFPINEMSVSLTFILVILYFYFYWVIRTFIMRTFEETIVDYFRPNSHVWKS